MAVIAGYSIDDCYKQAKGQLRDIRDRAGRLASATSVTLTDVSQYIEALKQSIALCDDRAARFDYAEYALLMEGVKGYDFAGEYAATRAVAMTVLTVMAGVAKLNATYAVDEDAKTVSEPVIQLSALAKGRLQALVAVITSTE